MCSLVKHSVPLSVLFHTQGGGALLSLSYLNCRGITPYQKSNFQICLRRVTVGSNQLKFSRIRHRTDIIQSLSHWNRHKRFLRHFFLVFGTKKANVLKLNSINSFDDFVMKSVCRGLYLSIKMIVHCPASCS